MLLQTKLLGIQRQSPAATRSQHGGGGGSGSTTAVLFVGFVSVREAAVRLAVVTLSSATSSSISSASGRTLPAQDNTSVQPIDIYSVLDERLQPTAML